MEASPPETTSGRERDAAIRRLAAIRAFLAGLAAEAGVADPDAGEGVAA